MEYVKKKTAVFSPALLSSDVIYLYVPIWCTLGFFFFLKTNDNFNGYFHLQFSVADLPFINRSGNLDSFLYAS